MGSFSIRIVDGIEMEGERFAQGCIVIGDFREDFHASLSYWSGLDYERQWKDALTLLLNGRRKSALVTSMYDPRTENFIMWWPLYFDAGEVCIQSGILFLEDVDGDLDEKNVYDYVPDRETVTEEGDKISEWKVSVADVEEFLREQ